jgi:hypothetical protein
MTDLHPLIQLAILIFGPTGAAFVGVKLTLNGTREDVREIKADVKALGGTVTGLDKRVTVIEDRADRHGSPPKRWDEA